MLLVLLLPIQLSARHSSSIQPSIFIPSTDSIPEDSISVPDTVLIHQMELMNNEIKDMHETLNELDASSTEENQSEHDDPADSVLVVQMEMMNQEMDEIHETLEELEAETTSSDEKKKFVHFGLSLGYRWLTNKSSKQNLMASVSPIDSTLRLTRMERTSYLFSTSVIFDLHLGKNRKPEDEFLIPERRMQRKSARASKSKKEDRIAEESTATLSCHRTNMGKFLYNSASRICIISNLNILDFSSGQKELAFNKSIEGGLGIGYKHNETMYIGFNWEHVQTWQLQDDIKAFKDEQITLNGEQLVSSVQLDMDNEDLFYKKNLSGWGIKLILSL